MLGSLKKLFFKDTDEDLATSIPEPVAVVAHNDWAAAPTVSAPTVFTPQSGGAAAPSAQPGKAPELLSLPLQAIFARLPNSLASVVQSQGNGFVSLPTQKILQELPKGSVKIRFGELRHAAPPGTFYDNARLDQVLVELPLSEILMRLPPSLLSRRADQKQIQVSPEITDVFGPHGEGISLATTPLNAPKQTGPVTTGDTAVLKKGDTSISKRNDTAFRLRNVPAPEPNIHQSPTAVVQTLHLVETESEPAVEQQEPVVVPLSLLCEGWPEMVQAEIRELNLANTRVAIPVNRLAEVLRTGKIVFAWKQICAWMQPPVDCQSGAQDVQVDLPLKVVTPLFMAKHRSAKVQKTLSIAEIPDLFTKKPSAEISLEAAPAQPAPTVVPPVVAKPVVPAIEPIKSSAPIAFVAPASPKIEPAVPKIVVAPITVQPALQMKPDNVTPLPKPVEIKPTLAPEPKPFVAPIIANPSLIGEIFKQPARHDWPPAEVLKNLVTLPGVAGSFLAMQDGLLIAAELPATIKAETVAAFLPQIFGRMNQYTKELQIGGLSSLTLVVENVSWQIVKSGTIYLVALSKSGENLPSAQLNTLATELSKKMQ